MTGSEITERLLAIAQRINAAPLGPYEIERDGDNLIFMRSKDGEPLATLWAEQETAAEFFAHARSDMPFLMLLVSALMKQHADNVEAEKTIIIEAVEP